MKTRVIVEHPFIELHAKNADGPGETVKVYRSDIVYAKLGMTWTPDHKTNNQRGRHDELLTLVFKNSDGAALLHKVFGTTCHEKPVMWQDEPELIWIEFH